MHLSSNVEVYDDLIYTLFVPLIKCVAEAVLSDWLDFLVNLSSDSFLHIVQRCQDIRGQPSQPGSPAEKLGLAAGESSNQREIQHFVTRAVSISGRRSVLRIVPYHGRFILRTR